VAFGLGFWGWNIKDAPVDFHGWFNNFFRTIQLVTLNFPTSLDETLPWQLQVARLAVPVIAVIASFQAIVASIRRPMQMALFPFLHDHILVYHTELLGQAALRRLSLLKRRLIIISEKIDEAKQKQFDLFDISSAELDPRDLSTFESLKLKNAKALFLISADTHQNLNLIPSALVHVKQRAHDLEPLIIIANVDRETLGVELVTGLDGLAVSEGIRFQRINLQREGLQGELMRWRPDLLKTDPRQPTHVLVIGLAGAWEGVILQLLLTLQDTPDSPPMLTLFLDDAETAAFERFRQDRPDLRLIATFNLVKCSDPRQLQADAFNGWPQSPPFVLALIMRPDEEALATALYLRRPGNALYQDSIPILIGQSQENHLLGAVSHMDVRYRDLNRIVPFGGVIREETIERVLDSKHEELAIALHRHYLAATAAAPASQSTSFVDWEALPENVRQANRAAADHARIIFGFAGIRIVPLVAGLSAPNLTKTEMESLAKIEHRRWCADRIDQGWRHGQTRNDQMRIHPDLVPYEQLSSENQEKDRSAIRALLASLSLASRVAVREDYVIVGVKPIDDASSAIGQESYAPDLGPVERMPGRVVLLALRQAEDAPALMRIAAETVGPVWLIHEMALIDALSESDEAVRHSVRRLIARSEICRRQAVGDLPASWKRIDV